MPTVVRYGLCALIGGWSLAVVQVVFNVTGWVSLGVLMAAMGITVRVGRRIDRNRGEQP